MYVQLRYSEVILKGIGWRLVILVMLIVKSFICYVLLLGVPWLGNVLLFVKTFIFSLILIVLMFVKCFILDLVKKRLDLARISVRCIFEG